MKRFCATDILCDRRIIQRFISKIDHSVVRCVAFYGSDAGPTSKDLPGI